MVDRDSFLELFHGSKTFESKKVFEAETYVVVEINLSSTFRKLESPVRCLISSHRHVISHIQDDSDWLDHLYDTHKGHSDLFLLVLSDIPAKTVASSKNRIKHAIESSTYIRGQPLIPMEPLRKKSGDPKVLRDLIIKNIGNTSLICPYRTDTSTSHNMFFGRKDILRRIKDEKENTFIFGTRRIGKTSIAMKLRDSYGNLRTDSGQFKPKSALLNRCAYVDLSEHGKCTADDLWSAIIEGFSLDKHHLFKSMSRKFVASKTWEGKYRPSFTVDMLTGLKQFIAKFSGQLTIILDEVDDWIAREAQNKWETVNQLRAITDEGKCKVILIGYENLMIASLNHRFPFWQRRSSYQLAPLTKQEIKELVLEPLKELTIRLDPEAAIIDRIWQTTSGLPHLVQDICRHSFDLCIGDEERVLNNAKLNTAIAKSESIHQFGLGVQGCDFPLAEAIAGFISFSTFKSSVPNGDDADLNFESNEEVDFSGNPHNVIAERQIINYFASSGDFEYRSEEFSLAMHYLELRSILKPADSTRTLWTWVNELLIKKMASFISNKGFTNWRNDVIRRHNQGKWRTAFQILGTDV